MKSKFFAILLMVAVEAPLISGVSVYAEESGILDRSTLSQKEQIVYDYFDTINSGDWEAWAELHVLAARDNYRDFVSNQVNIDNNTGILTIDSVELIDIVQVGDSYAPPFSELSPYFLSNDTYDCYKVAVDLTVAEESESYHDGINQKLVVLVNENGNWEVGGTTSFHSQSPTGFSLFSTGITPLGVGYGFLPSTGTLSSSQPTSIDVYYNGNVYNTTFSEFVKNATQNEIGNMSYDSDAFAANCMAVKMCGWWAKLGRYRETYGADIMYGDVAYVPGTTTISNSVTTAYSTISSKRAVSSGSKAFYMAYFAGSYDNTGAGTGQMRQNGSSYLADQGYSWQEILHYYYDSSSYNNGSTGTIQILG
jgi:hypothetical protein